MKFKKYTSWKALSSYEMSGEQGEHSEIYNKSPSSCSYAHNLGSSPDTHTLTGLERFIKKYGRNWNGKVDI